MQPQNAYTLGGLLHSVVIPLTAAQLRTSPTVPILLIGSPAQNFAILLRTILVSYAYGSQVFTGGLGSQCALYSGGPSRRGVAGGAADDPSLWLSFKITSVAAAVSGDTVFTVAASGLLPGVPLSSMPADALVGYQVFPTGCGNSANNVPATIVSQGANTLTVSNPSGVLESSPPSGAAMRVYAPGPQVGGGPTYDLTTILTEQTESVITGSQIDSWNFPVREVSGAGIYLGSAQTGLAIPSDFTGGDSSMLLSLEYLVAQLSG